MRRKTNKHTDVVQQLRKILRTQKPGDRLANDRVMAAQLGVSTVTVRGAMMELANEGLLERRVGSGTYVIESKVEKHIAIVASQELLDCSRIPYLHLATMSILNELNHRVLAYKLYIIPTPAAGEDELKWPEPVHIANSGLAQAIEAGRVSALVSISIGRHNGWAADLEDQGIPVVGVSSDITYKYRIATKWEAGLREAVHYLTRFGRRRIGLISWLHPEDPFQPPVDPAIATFQEEMTMLGQTVHPEWIKNDADPRFPASGWQLFREIWVARPDEKPDAIIFTDDRLFSSAAAAMLEMGISVPRDLQVVTHWNKGSGLLCPFPVARYVFDMSPIGSHILELIERSLAKPDLPPETIYIPGHWFTEGQYDSSMGDQFLDPHVVNMRLMSTTGTTAPPKVKA